jgi:signal transduction histidine kinase/CheY-like chemotaxis protein
MFHRSTTRSQPIAVMAILLVVGGICLLVPILVGQFLSGGQKQLEYYETLQQTIETRTRTHRLFAAIQDVEAAQRGFLLTGQPEFLSQYEQAARELPGRLQALKVQVSHTSLEPLARQLDELIPATVAELARTNTTYQQSGPAAAAEIVADGPGKQYLARIRGAIDEMLSIENSNVARLSGEIREQAASSQAVILKLFGAIILAVLVAGAAGLIYFAHRRRTEQDLRDAWQTAEAAQQEAEAASRAKSEFLTTMSHEIRTPLHAVIGSAEILLENNELKLEQQEYVERIQVSGTALLNLVNDVLDLAKIEAGEVEISPEPFSLETLIDNSVSIVRTPALKKGLKLMVQLDHGLPLTLLGDEARLPQVLLNLLGNAVKFTPHGQVTLQVEDRGCTEAGEMLRFSVTDTGPGIPTSKHERLFRRFSQISQAAARSGGTGLGLAISKQLVELMGGEMGFESEEGRGSTFWFLVTLPQADADLLPQLVPEHLGLKQSGRLLVVDDLDQNRDLARKMLELAGYTVDLASNGAEAVAAVQASHYDLVLMDIQMDIMDGVAATKAIRGLDHPAKDVPIVAMTANVLAHDVKSFKAAGMNDHLGKPFKRKQLLDKVQLWLNAESAGQRAAAQSAAARKSPGPGFDQEALDELCSTMGREWVIRSLSELTHHLERVVEDPGPTAGNRDLLAQQAHLLVSRAGVLGFSELARLCGALEQACRRGQGIEPARSKVRGAALEVQETAAPLLHRLSVHT